MYSDEMVDPEITDPSVSMKQIGAAVVLNLAFHDGYSYDNTYNGFTIQSIEVTGLNSKGTFNPADGTFTNNSASTITVSDGTTVVANSKATIKFNIFPTEIAEGATIGITFYLVNKSDETSTTVAFTKTIEAGIDMNFERAKYHTIGCESLTEVAEYWTADGVVATVFKDTESTGEENDPIEITTARELALIAKRVNNTENPEHYTGKFFKLMNDIDLTGYKWETIGNYTNTFQGIFDGNNCTISGLYINESNDDNGLFGVIADATIKDLTISGSVNGKSNVGGFVGWSKYNTTNTITNCHNRCTITSTSSAVGGIIGNNQGANISNCSNSGAIHTPNGTCGGIAGQNFGSSINNCYNTASVTAGMDNVGGVVGHNQGGATISNSYNTGAINGAGNVGGVAAYNQGDILNSYNTASVTGSGKNVGGVAGYSKASSNDTYIQNSYNRGSVSGANNIGGIMGYSSGSYDPTTYTYIKNCYSASSVTATGTDPEVGGIVGKIDQYSNVTYCYWDNSLWNGNTNGYGYKGTEDITVSDLKGYSTDKMTDGTTVIEVLNDQKGDKKAWIQGADGYPTLAL